MANTVMQSAPGMDARLVDMESRLAFQEQTLVQMSDQVAAQQLQIDKLERLTRALSEHIRDMANAAAGSQPVDETPPHY